MHTSLPIGGREDAVPVNSVELTGTRSISRPRTKLLAVLAFIVGLFVLASTASAQNTVGSVSASRSAIAGGVGNSLTVTVTPSNLNASANMGLASGNAAILVDGAAAGSRSSVKGAQTFTITAPNDTASDVAVTLTATVASSTATLTITVKPFVSSVALSPNTIFGGQTVSGSVTVFEAPASAQTVSLSSNKANATVPANISISGTSGAFTVNSTNPNADQTVTISASHIATGTSAASNTFTLSQVKISTVVASRTALAGGVGNSLTVTVTPNTNVVSSSITLASNNTKVKVEGGATSTKSGTTAQVFTITAPEDVAADAAAVIVKTCAVAQVFTITAPEDVAADAAATLTASLDTDSKTQSITVKPFVSSVTFGGASINGGASVNGTVTVFEAPASAQTVSLSSNRPNATVAGSISVSGTTGSFTVNSTNPNSNQTVTISASHLATGTSTATNSFSLNTVTAASVGTSLGGSVVTGGIGSTFTVTVTPSDITVPLDVTLASNNSNLKVEGSNTNTKSGTGAQTFTITAPTGVASDTSVALTATIGGDSSKNASITVRPFITGVSIAPAGVFGGTSATATVTVVEHPSSPITIALASNNPHATVPGTAIVATDGTCSFQITTDDTATSVVTPKITASLDSNALFSTFEVGPIPGVSAMTLGSNMLLAGTGTTLTVNLTSKVLSDSFQLEIRSAQPDKIPSPGMISIPRNATSFQVPITSLDQLTGGSWALKIRAMLNEVELNRVNVTVGKPAPKTLAATPASFTIGGSSSMTLTLAWPVAADTTVTINSSQAAKIAPFDVVIPAGQDHASVNFSSISGVIAAPANVTLSATLNGVTKSTVVTLNPVPAMKSITVSPNSVIEGDSSTATVTLSAPVTTETVINVVSANTARVANFDVTIPAGQDHASATVATTQTGLPANASVGLSASFGSVTKSTSLQLTPVVLALTAVPNPATSTATVTFTITLAKAQATDTTFTLSGSGFADITGATIVIPAGQMTGSKVLTTKKVTAVTNVTVKAIGLGATRSCPVTINP